jgi:hypothetical protein
LKLCKHINKSGGQVYFLLAAVQVAILLAGPTLGQNTAAAEPQLGIVAGTVTDPNDQVVPSATVTLESTALAERYSVVANDNGFFEFQGVKPGIPYQVTVHSAGFADWRAAIKLETGQYKLLGNCKLQLEGVETTVNVGYSSVEVATEQVALEEKQRVFGVIPNFYVVYDRHPESLTPKLKFKLALRLASDPITLAGIGLVAGIRQAADSPNYQQNAKGYGQRFGVTAANGLTDIMLGSALLPSLLHQDPRYFYQGTGTKTSRFFHALSYPIVCQGDNGHQQLNYSNLIGDLGSAAISNTYYPRSNRGAGLVFGNVAIGLAESSIYGLAEEFLLRRFTSKAKSSN